MIAPRHAFALAVALAATAAASTAAHAGPAAKSKPTSPADVAYQEGRRHYDLREWDDAIAAFKESYRLRPDERSLFNIAQAYRLEGDCVEALGFYQTYKRNFPTAPGIAAVDKLLVDVEACARAKTAAQSAKPEPHEPPESHEPRPTAAPDARPAPSPPQAPERDEPDEPAAPADGGRALRVTGGVVAGVGIAAIAGGALFALHGSSLSDQVSSGSGAFDPSLQADGKAANRDSAILFAAGGAMIVTGIVLYILGHPSESLAHLALVPHANGGELVWAASF